MAKRTLLFALLTLAAVACASEDAAEPAADTVVSPSDDGAVDVQRADAVPDVAGDLAAPDVQPETALEPALGGWTVGVDAASGTWSVVPPGGMAPVLRGGGDDAVAVGRGAPEVLTAFGGFEIRLDEGITWHSSAAGRPTVEQTRDRVALRWEIAGAGAAVTLAFSLHEGRDLMLAVSAAPADRGNQVDAAALRFDIDADESFFGLGAQTYGMDLRGGRFPLWTQEQGIGKPDDYRTFPLGNVREAAYAPMGIWHSSAGYTAIIGHDAFSELDLDKQGTGRGVLRSYLDLPSFVLVAGETGRDRVSNLGTYVGRPIPAPDWVLAPWNDAVGGPTHLAEVAAKLRAQGIPSSAIWSEDWAGGSEGPTGYRLNYSWSWDPNQYPDLASDISGLHANGFAFLGYFNPFVPHPTARYEGGAAAGHLVGDPAGGDYVMSDPAARDAGLVDLSSPAALEWFYGFVQTAVDLGIDGWMADFAEWLPVDATLASGESPWRFHNRYPLEWQRANLVGLQRAHGEDHGSWSFFARSGWASIHGGSAGVATTMWGGDQDTDWDYDDGMPSVVPIGAHLGLGGVAIFGSDIAGYSAFLADPTNKELFYRWTTMASFQVLMRTHHGSSECANWSFDRDAETLQHYKRWATIHTLLYPLFRGLCDEAVATGVPPVRHPWLVAPDQRRLWEGEDYVFFLGDDLFIAPVLAEGASGRVVELPSAGWWPLFGTAPVAGDTPTVAAAPTEIPVFVRPGTAIPLLAEPVDSFYGATSADVTDLGDVRGRFRVALYPDAAGAVKQTSVGGATVAAAGLVAPIDWSVATLNGEPLPACGAAAGSCHRADGLELTVAAAQIVVGTGTLTIASETEQSYIVGVGGAAWGTWAEPTALTELNPDIPPPCEQ